MARSPVAQPYAKALLDIASQQGAVDKLRTELRTVSSLVERSKDLSAAFSVPTVTVGECKAVIEAVSARLAVSPTTKNFLLLLADKRRLAYVRDIIAAYEEMADEATGLLRAHVYSPVSLSLEQRETLRQTLEKKLSRKVIIDARIDASLLGGLRVEVAGKIYDASVRSQLETLRDRILHEA